MNIFYRIINYIENIPTKIKWFIQRGKKGYCDRDTWNIDEWFLNVIIPMLQQLKNEKHGHPSDKTEEEWDECFDRMIKCFVEANEKTCSIKNEFEEDFNKYSVDYLFGDSKDKEEPSIEFTQIRDKWIQRETEINKYRTKMKNEGLQLFSEYFYDLWD